MTFFERVVLACDRQTQVKLRSIPCSRIRKLTPVGEWLSLVEHLVRDQGVGGSNPLSPTNLVLAFSLIPQARTLDASSIAPALAKTQGRGTLSRGNVGKNQKVGHPPAASVAIPGWILRCDSVYATAFEGRGSYVVSCIRSCFHRLCWSGLSSQNARGVWSEGSLA